MSDDRDRIAFLPDETPVRDLPLRPYTANALRAGHVLTLGELRTMRDRELKALRNFGRAALVDARSLVPAPEREMVVSAGSEVTIAGRVFRLGAIYAPAPHVRPYEPGRLLPLRLVGYESAYPWPGGRVEAELVPSSDRLRAQGRRLSGRAWAAWAGGEVGDGPGEVGR